ncbi:thiolase family protein [Sinorhizobium fredii]|uniref:thiolase family protein n=1 Tax=Rhizobium fredii TaxID=380 RepID=UPI000B053776|nr:thiolase family protein [Sinorhizobium fredii]WOS65487.1 thiolase family protein [Sinorhizobium fredii GR64]
MYDPDRLSAMSRAFSIVGIGETDYAADYEAHRRENTPKDSYELAALAFKRALDDCGLERADIDGLVTGPTLAMERTGEILGVNPGFAAQGDAVNAVMQAMLALQSGLAECVAVVYGNAQRSGAIQYGGPQAMGGERFLAYVYYSPWGLTSQGSLYAMMMNRYMHDTGFTEQDLGRIVIGQRAFAALNPGAIMREPLSLEAYLQGRLICEPLRLFDYCLINDGGVAMILTNSERARKLRQPPVSIAGIGRHDINSEATSLRPRLEDFYHQGHARVAEQVYGMAGIGPEDVDGLQIYDSFSAHIPFAIEGFGFCGIGEAARLVREGALAPGGRLPVNTSGGMLSESYMQGWNHQVEAVRQLRLQAGERQLPQPAHVQYLSDVAGKVASVIYRAEAA